MAKAYTPKEIKKFILKHLLIAGVVGAGALLVSYYWLLNTRTALEGGYHSSPLLTTMSELNWFILGGFLYLVGMGITQYFKQKKRKKRK